MSAGALRSQEFARCRASAAAPELNLSVWLLGECQKNWGARFVGWPGSNVFAEVGRLEVLTWAGQPFRLPWKGGVKLYIP